MNTTANKYSNRNEWRYGLIFIQTGVYCTMEGKRDTHGWREINRGIQIIKGKEN